MILITGSSGAVGSRVARILKNNGESVRLLARDASRVPEDLQTCEIVTGEYEKPESLAAAFDGVRAALIVSVYAEPMQRALLHKNAIDAAARAGVGHLAYTSFQCATPESKFPYGRDHHQTELYLEASGVTFSSLQDSLYQDIAPHLADDQDRIRGPAGKGKVAWVARDDVARVAAQLLAQPPANSQRYELTGPEALDLDETASRLSQVLGRKFVYEEETEADGRKWRSEYDAPQWEQDVWIGTYLAMAAGEMATLSGAVKDITGREPQTFEATFAGNS